MLDVSFSVDVSGVERRLRLLSDALSPDAIDEALKKYGETWLRARVQEHVDRARPPKAATAARAERRGGGAEARGAARLKVKLSKDLRRARSRLGILEESGGFEKERARQDFLASQGRRHKSMPEVIASRKAAVERRESVLGSLERLAAGVAPSGRAEGKLKERLDRSVGRERGRKPLGKIGGSFKLTVADGRLTYGSEIPWSGVHDKGGTVGHGAVIQPNPFAYLEDIDLEVLVAALMAEGIAVTAG